jgi:hypothetical protein
MKYVKTFESFNYETTNEGLLWGEGNIWKKAKDAFVNWKNKKYQEVADKLSKMIEEKKDDPQMQEAITKVQEASKSLSAEDKAKIGEFAKGQIPEGEAISEALLLEGDTPVINKILKVLGLSTGAFGLISASITLLKITGALAGATMFGVFLGPALAIFCGLMAIGGIISCVGFVRADAVEDEKRSKEAVERIRKHYGVKPKDEEQ